jgi:hypothetical protein
MRIDKVKWPSYTSPYTSAFLASLATVAIGNAILVIARMYEAKCDLHLSCMMPMTRTENEITHFQWRRLRLSAGIAVSR